MHVVRGVDIDDLADGVRNMLQRDGIASDHPDDGHDDYDDAGKHRADQKSLLVMPDMAEVPRSVTSVAHQYMAIEKQPHEKPVLREVGHADHVGDRRRCEAEYGGYHTTFWIHCRKMAVKPMCLLKASLTHV